MLNSACLHAVYGIHCGGIPISGEVPPDAKVTDNSLSTRNVYNVGSSPDYAGIAAQHGLECNLSGLLDAKGAEFADDAVGHLWAAMDESCPGVVRSRYFQQFTWMEPEQVLAYECPQDCVDFLLNLGVCATTVMSEVCWMSRSAAPPLRCHACSCCRCRF